MSSSVLSQGDIVLVPVPQTNPYFSYMNLKPRPALIVSNSDFNDSTVDVILVAISSNPSNMQRKSQFNIKVVKVKDSPEFSHTGLKESSTIMCGKIFAMDRVHIQRKIGVLPAKFMEQVKQALTHLF